MGTPRRPAVLLFTTYADEAFVSGERYVQDPSGDPAHTKTRAQIREVTTGTIVGDYTTTTPTTNVRLDSTELPSEGLIEGTCYQARLQYENGDGWSGWGGYFVSMLHRTTPTAWTSLAIPDEPDIGGALPIDPDYAITRVRRRTVLERRMETGHVLRRPRATDPREAVELIWSGLTETDRDSLVTFLQARADAGEAFTATASEFGSRAWLTRAGTIDSEVSDLVWTVRVLTDEIIRGRVFTVGRSIIGGDDPIRQG